MGWLTCSVFAALPYLFCTPGLALPEALFESVSGLTTTGASVFDDLAVLPETILLWRSFTQWIGGIGILAMFVLVLSGLAANGRSLFLGESSAHVREIADTTMRNTVRSIWSLYIVLTAICATGLWIFGMTPFQALNHAMTTVSTGGFGTEPDSLNSFGTPILVWITVFMLLCGISFPLLISLIGGKRDWRRLKSHEETWWYLAMMVAASIALIIDRAAAADWSLADGEVLESLFNAAAIATTTGFVVGDYDTWPFLAEGVILGLMIIGGCAGSTAGGLKVSRVILWFKTLRIEIRRAYRPTESIPLSLNGRPVMDGTRGQLLIILSSAAAVIAIGSYILIALEPGKSIDGCVSAVISSLSNIGPAFNEFGPSRNFADLSPPSLVLLSLLMLIGRLEYIAVFVLCSRMLWRKY